MVLFIVQNICIHEQFFMVQVAEIDPRQKPQDKLLIFFSAPSPPRTLGVGENCLMLLGGEKRNRKNTVWKQWLKI